MFVDPARVTPAVAVANFNAALPSVHNSCPALPSAIGWQRPSIMTMPLPLGVIGMLPLLAEIILLLFTSRFPPNLGPESHCKQGAAIVAVARHA